MPRLRRDGGAGLFGGYVFRNRKNEQKMQRKLQNVQRLQIEIPKKKTAREENLAVSFFPRATYCIIYNVVNGKKSA